MRNAGDMSPPTSQPTEYNGLTEDKALDRKSEEEQLALSLFSRLENDPDFLAVAEKWTGLSDELRQAIVKMVE